MADGVDPRRIAFMAFTRKAAEEARGRAVARFKGLTKEDLPWFRTIHSTAYALAELSHTAVMTRKHYDELGKALGLTFHHDYTEGRIVQQDGADALGDKLMRVYGLSRARCAPLEEQHRRSSPPELPWAALRNFEAALKAYKRDRQLFDFADMLDVETMPLDVDLLVVDEAQDLTPQQWRYVRRIGADAPVIIIGGDDDQAIYDWAGADAGQMLRFRGERVVLPHSYRLPDAIKRVADSVLEGVYPRVPKLWKGRGAGGTFDTVASPDDADLLNGRSWLLLARHRRQMTQLVGLCRRVGVVYQHDGVWSNQQDAVRSAVAYERLRAGHEVAGSEARLVAAWIVDMAPPDNRNHTWQTMPWPWLPADNKPNWMEALTRMAPTDREYVRELRRNGEPLSGPGRITISTVHGAKGGEAHDVLLMTDVSRRVDPQEPSERRVLYVGVTRAAERLLIVRPRTPRHWKI